MSCYMEIIIQLTIKMLKDYEHKDFILLNGKYLKFIDFLGLQNISKGFKI